MKKLNLYRFQIQDKQTKEWLIKNISEVNYNKAKNMVKEMYSEKFFLVLPLTM